MKLNFWQWLGVVLLVAWLVMWLLSDGVANPPSATQPME